jgi:segregation and condensation protein A
MALPVKIENFEGPLDLLLHLIDVNKFNIFDIPIVEITEQYLEFVRNMETKDLNVMSEFLVMAATLLEIKAKMLLPVEVDEEGEEIDPREELVQKLLEYKMYKYMSYELKDRMQTAAKAMYKNPTIPEEVEGYIEPVDLEKLIGELTLKKLNDIFQSVMKRQNDKVDPIRSKFGKIEKEEVSLEDKLDFVEAFAKEHGTFSFRKMLEGQKSKMEIVVTFLAILELMKVGKIVIRQESAFADIVISSSQYHRKDV